MIRTTKNLFAFLLALPILLMVSCSKESTNDNTGGDNNLAENNFAVAGTIYASNSTYYFNLNNEIVSCYQIGPDGVGGFDTNYCVHIFFNGNSLPLTGGTYDVVYFGNLSDNSSDKELSLSVYQNNDVYFSFDATTYQFPAAGVIQKAIVTVVNGKVTVKFTNLKLFGNTPTPIIVSGNIVIQQV